jgi:hypothetical protein
LYFDIDLHETQYICMRTTLNLPDPMVAQAKRRALEECTTMTELLVQGLKSRLETVSYIRDLPVSKAGGGLCEGVSWEDLAAAEPEEERYR